MQETGALSCPNVSPSSSTEANLYNGMRENLQQHPREPQRVHRAADPWTRRLTRTYYYNAPLTDDYGEDLREGQQRFFESLRRIPYVTVRLGRLHRRHDGSLVEKGIDVAIAVESFVARLRGRLRHGAAGERRRRLRRAGRGASSGKGKHVECAMFKQPVGRDPARVRRHLHGRSTSSTGPRSCSDRDPRHESGARVRPAAQRPSRSASGTSPPAPSMNS